MLNYAETTSGRTIVPVTPVSSMLSYAIGPIDPTYVVTMHAPLSDGEECTLLIPLHLPLPILSDPAFREGYEWNYLSEEEEEEEEAWTKSVPGMVNHIYTCLTADRFSRDLVTGEAQEDILPWQVGWLLRDLTRLAETDRTLASVGMAHFAFLLPLLTQERPANWPRYESYDAHNLHDRAVKAYRERVRVYRQQGKGYDEAQRLALAGSMQEEMCSKEVTR